jgi:hypothetical protein
LKKLGREGMYLNIIKNIYDKPIAYIVLNWEKLRPFRNETRMSTFSTLIPYNAWIPNHSDKAREKIKEIQTEKEEIKLSLFADDMVQYLKTLKTTPKTHVWLTLLAK